MQTANFRLCLEIFSVFPAAARNQEGGKTQTGIHSASSVPLIFPPPVKQNSSYKTGGSREAWRKS